jgi:peroxiredoxin
VSPLVGKPAPDFSVKLLDGGVFSLAEQKGKVVVLDFWASWCGPCRRGLPAVVKMTSGLASQGVVFCGVNQEEDAETIREFLKDEKLQFSAGMDANGAVGAAYGLVGIPMTVVVDRNGVVKAVHTGYDPDQDESLRGEIESALGAKGR